MLLVLYAAQLDYGLSGRREDSSVDDEVSSYERHDCNADTMPSDFAHLTRDVSPHAPVLQGSRPSEALTDTRRIRDRSGMTFAASLERIRSIWNTETNAANTANFAHLVSSSLRD